ncbi:uncharacterized protein LOC121384500 [Gigantopelta aegis]|uniref:uncharacterized protein LOC121384500 n=1 Tax=Gigantopelta aegis TaxID=1735272 RepID=UPI001B88CBD7|nr:uncharacterized protein LOC121384500 [Gigantopelta aegis]
MSFFFFFFPCSKFFEFQDCVVPDYRRCSAASLKPYTNTLNIYTFVCLTGYRDILKHEACWKQPVVKTQFKLCAEQQQNNSQFRSQDICSIIEHFEDCMISVVNGVCDVGAVNVLHSYFDRIGMEPCSNPTSTESTQPTSTTTTSTTTTTTVTPETTGSIHCYSCNSGYYPSYRNAQCPVDGELQTSAVAKVKCDGPCVSKTNKWNKGDIFRECSSAYWQPEPFPRSGCHKIRGEVYCFCDTDLCNTQSMEDFVERHH